MTQLRAELRLLLATSNAPPDFSLVPLHKAPSQAPLPPTVLATSKIPRPKPQLRQSSSLLRKNTNRRRATADAVVTGRETSRRRATADAVITSRPVSLSSKAQTTALQPLPASGKVAKQKGLLQERAVASSSRAVSSSPKAVVHSLSANCSNHGTTVSALKAGQESSSSTSATDAANAVVNIADAAALRGKLDSITHSLSDCTAEAGNAPHLDLAITMDQAVAAKDQGASTSRQLSKSISWPVSSSSLRDGVTQNGAASSSYSFRSANALQMNSRQCS